MPKVKVSQKQGYAIFAEVNPKTKRLFNFSVSGSGVNPKIDYTYITSCEGIIDGILHRNEKAKQKPKK
jgi:hypothetical protein